MPENEEGELKNTQKNLDSLLGIDFNAYTKSVVLGQNIFTNFLLGTQQQRRSIIEGKIYFTRSINILELFAWICWQMCLCSSCAPTHCWDTRAASKRWEVEFKVSQPCRSHADGSFT